MTLIQTKFIGGAYEDRSSNVDPQRCVNLFPSVDHGNVLTLQPTPGLNLWLNTGVAHPVRSLLYHAKKLWAVVGNQVYSISSQGSYSVCSGNIGTYSGQCFMVANANGQIMVVDVSGGKGYYIESNAINEITDTDFITPSSLAFQDGYGIVTEKDTQRFWLSSLNDFSEWSALDYGSAESMPDDVIACVSDHRELWMFGEKTAEPHQNTGDNDFPFVRIGSAVQEIGISAPASIAKLDNTIFWLDQWGNIRRMNGYVPQVVSSPQIAYHISTYPEISNAIAFGYVHEGHSFYVITFPSANGGKGVTWCYDASTGYWHQRSSFPYAPVSRWRANCYAFFNDMHLVGDCDRGKIYKLDHSIYQDDGEVLPALRVGQTVENGRMPIFIHSFELHIESGVGIISGQGSDPMVMLRYSKDGGHTWSNEKWRSMGKIGQFGMRVRWTQLGRARSWTPEITITDPVNRTIIGAYLDGTAGR